MCRDRIADLQLQAEGSLDSEVLAPAPPPERYRLLSADSSAVSSTPPTRERAPSPPLKGTARVIEKAPSPRSFEREVTPTVDIPVAAAPTVTEVAAPQANAAESAGPVNYRDVIMSIREEIDEDNAASARARAAAILASAVGAVKERKKATAIGVAAIAFLVLLASVSSAWSESALLQTAGATAVPPVATPTPSIPTAGLSASASKRCGDCAGGRRCGRDTRPAGKSGGGTSHREEASRP